MTRHMPRPRSESRPGRRPRTRLSQLERRTLILDRAAEFLSEHGFAGQTRALAAACGVSQRLLYRHFPTKAALVEEVYRRAIVSPFEQQWLTRLANRKLPIDRRIVDLYLAYFDRVLTRKWLRLFLHSSLTNGYMAPDYIAARLITMLELMVNEIAAALRVGVPDDPPLIHELGWYLHGAVSHLAIRRHLYKASLTMPFETILAGYVASFLEGFPAMVRAVRRARGDGTAARAVTRSGRSRKKVVN